MGAAAVRFVHVPDPRRSGTIATVDEPNISSTPSHVLRRALGRTGRSLSQVAEQCGVSKQRASKWLSDDGEAAPNLGHLLRAPADVRVAVAKELVASTEARVLPVPLALYERAALEVLSKVSALTLRIEDLRASGDERARRAALQEIHDLRTALDRIERGVLLAGKEAP